MSIYSVVSKRIGWEGAEKIPSLVIAQTLHERIVKYKDVGAFESVFAINRFAPSPQTFEESQAMNEINKAFIAGEQIFRDQEAT